MSPGKLSPAPPSSDSWSSSQAPPPCKWWQVSTIGTANINICSLLQAELALVTLVGGHQAGHELVQGHIAVDYLEQGVINSSVTIVDCVPTWNISMLPLNFAIKMTSGSFSMPKFRTVEEATLPKCLDTMSRNLRG